MIRVLGYLRPRRAWWASSARWLGRLLSQAGHAVVNAGWRLERLGWEKWEGPVKKVEEEVDDK